MKLLCFLLLLVPIFGIPLRSVKEEQCTQSCPDLNPNDLNVHLIAHSHDDVGWLKSVDQYYYGSRSDIQIAGVQHIITSVVQALLANPKRKFVQAETAFFQQWWIEQTDKRKDDVKKLIKNGQLQIVGGGWSMNDEAAAHYQSIIDQLTFGLKYLEDTLGVCARPRIGWQIDPFGHTREMASIFSQMGYDGLFFARLDWRDKAERLNTLTAEMLWRSSENLGNDSLLFTHVMFDHYSPPKGFYFDVLSEDDPLIPDQQSTEYNMKKRIQDFNTYVVNQAGNYSSNNIMIAMGNDFTYQDAHYNYKNLDILIKAYEDTNQISKDGRRIRLFYSTPYCYLKAVNDAKLTYKVKTDDFIPYATDYHTYWSGYYTSRPTQKRFERMGNNFLQILKQLHVFSGLSDEGYLYSLKAAMGVMQHHDAITGTEKQHVADDYARNFMRSLSNSQITANSILKKLLAKAEQEPKLEFNSCLLANVSHCDESQKQRFVITLYNPLSRKVSHHVRVPTNSTNFEIYDPDGNKIQWQIVPSIHDFSYIPNINPSMYDLVFLAKEIPPLGVHVYYVIRLDTPGTPPQPTDTYKIGDDNNGVTLNPNTLLMIKASLNGLEQTVHQELMYYIGAQGNNEEFKNRSSGAYIFRPDPDHPNAIKYVDLLDDVNVYKGEIVDEIHQVFNDWNRQIIRVYKHQENYIEFDWLVGPIDIEANFSKEIISRFLTELPDIDNFYTDSNGREMLLRTNNYRSTYNFSINEPVAGNYYPITSAISLRDNNKHVEVAVVTDRAQGGASLESGLIELMVHRRLLKDDAFGAGEALNEHEFHLPLVVRGQHYLTFGSTLDNDKYPMTRKLQRDIAQRKILAPWMFVSDASGEGNDLENLKKTLNFKFSGLRRDLPSQVQILTLEPWSNNTVLMRLEHVLELADGGTDESIDLEGLFELFEVTNLEETTLAGNTRESRLQWNAGKCLDGSENCDVHESKFENLDDYVVTLTPMQIRTFIVTIKMRKQYFCDF